MPYVHIKSRGFVGNVTFELSASEAAVVLDAKTADQVPIGSNGERISVDTLESVTWHQKRANGTYKTWPMDRADLIEKLKSELAKHDD